MPREGSWGVGAPVWMCPRRSGCGCVKGPVSMCVSTGAGMGDTYPRSCPSPLEGPKQGPFPTGPQFPHLETWGSRPGEAFPAGKGAPATPCPSVGLACLAGFAFAGMVPRTSVDPKDKPSKGGKCDLLTHNPGEVGWTHRFSFPSPEGAAAWEGWVGDRPGPEVSVQVECSCPCLQGPPLAQPPHWADWKAWLL